MSRVCAETNCQGPIVARGLCRPHYGRHKHRGTLPPLTPRPKKAPRVCAVDGCDRQYHAHGYCGMHAARLRMNGDPVKIRRVDTVDAFWRRVNKDAPDGHWLWTGTVTNTGYGVISTRKRPVPGGSRSAHRAAWELVKGPIPEGMHMDHLCRIKLCVNPEHLEPVTVAENVRRGLHGVLRTHCNYGHQLTPENTCYEAKTNCRRCRTCARRWDARAKARKKARREAA